MKKLCILLVVMLSHNITNTFAQNEVRGVETKLVTYTACDGKDYFGYEFYNLNSIPVSVDAELYCVKSETILEKTKTFVLNSKEKYVWKHEHNDDFNTMHYEYGWDPRPKKYPGQYYQREYYIKYKAYKLE